MFGVSVDSTWAHEAWSRHLQLPDGLVLLSDFNREFGTAYDLLVTNPSGMRGVLRRTVLLIGQNGRLAYRWDVPDPPRVPRVDEILPEVLRLGR